MINSIHTLKLFIYYSTFKIDCTINLKTLLKDLIFICVIFVQSILLFFLKYVQKFKVLKSGIKIRKLKSLIVWNSKFGTHFFLFSIKQSNLFRDHFENRTTGRRADRTVSRSPLGATDVCRLSYTWSTNGRATSRVLAD